METVQLEIFHNRWTSVNKDGNVRGYVDLGYYTRFNNKIYRIVPQGREKLNFLHGRAVVIVDKKYLYIRNNIMYITYYTQVYPTVQTSGPQFVVVMKNMNELKRFIKPEREGKYKVATE